MSPLALLVLGAVGAATAAPGGASAPPLAELRGRGGWEAKGSDQVQTALRPDPGGGVCLAYDFSGVSGYALLRHALPLDWPAAFALRLRVHGTGPENDLQVKLVDPSGDNVWWVNRPRFLLPRRPAEIVLRERHFSFAWGPATDHALSRTASLELVVAAGPGGKGTLCVSGVRVERREPDPAVWPAPLVRRSAGALDLDYQRVRPIHGLTLRWPRGRPTRYDVLASDDGRRWRLLRRVERGPGGFEAVFLPELETRHLRIRLRGAERAWPEVELRDPWQWPDLNDALSELARHTPRGHVPRAFVGEQNYWALVGVDGGGSRSALLSEDGAVEVGRRGYSVEPAVLVGGGRLVTWADVEIAHALRDGDLPVPEVRWRDADLDLRIEAAADGPAASPEVLVRYALTNSGHARRRFTLLAAVRPWQVNPPQQFLSTPGGARRIDRLRWAAPRLLVNAAPGPRFDDRPARVTALRGEGGLDLLALLRAPGLRALTDLEGHASALVAWDVTLAPGETRVVSWSAPLGASAAAPGGPVVDRLERAADGWRARLGRVEITLPQDGRAVADTLRTALAQVLMSREGPALRPGTRAYARSWIRDGAMMVAALVRLGELDVARAFVDWYAGHVFDSGKVPCCVDARGADPVPENDSDGEYLYAVAEVWRHGRDPAFLQRHWPVVQRVVAHLEGLRQSTRTPAFRATHPENLFGLLPPSISHEGYSDKPAYAYWDDFWALRGYTDAVELARAMGQTELADRWAAWREEFQEELARSVEDTAVRFGLDAVAGAADRGDFDPTSTTAALDPAQARLPAELLQKTFERYWREAAARSDGTAAWKDFTPYELRNVGALARLGHPQRAQALLAWFMRFRRPAHWNGWAEVVMADARAPHFLGDMPHAWVASDYLRSVLDLFAYVREQDDALVLGAGLSPAWVAAGLSVKNLSTRYGPLSYRLRPQGTGHVLEVEAGLDPPPGGVRLAWAAPGPLPRALYEGKELPWDGREVVLPTVPATLELLP